MEELKLELLAMLSGALAVTSILGVLIADESHRTAAMLFLIPIAVIAFPVFLWTVITWEREMGRRR